MSNAQVTLSVGDYDKLRSRISELEGKLAETEAHVESLRLGGGDESAGRELVDTIRQASTVIRFAVANLNPESVRGWPYEELRLFAKGFAGMPSAGVYERELAAEFRAFSTEVEGYEVTRKPIRGTPPGPRASAADWGPQTEAAKVVHAVASGAKTVGQIVKDGG